MTSVAELLYNLTILITEEALLSINSHGIINLLINYMKPKLINVDISKIDDENYLKFYEYLIVMLKSILNYLILCCNLEKNCIIMFIKYDKFVSDLMDCLRISKSIGKKSLQSSAFKSPLPKILLLMIFF